MEHPTTNNLWMRLVIAAVAVVLATACYYDNEEDLYQFTNTGCDTTNVSFKNDIEPILQGNCSISGCHVAGGGGPGIFTNYAGVMEKVNNGTIRNRVLVQKDMPPGAPLTDCQLNLIRAWLDAGAPNN